jgi:hypothetical protein
MSLLPIPSSPDEAPTKSPPIHRNARFIPLSEASRRSGIPIETLKRHCIGKWADINLARKQAPAGGGKPCWHVSEAAEPTLFARVRSSESLPFDAKQYTAKQRATVYERRRLLDSWTSERAADRAAGLSEREATARFLARQAEQGRTLSRATLHAWERRFRDQGPAGLVDRRGRPAASDENREAFIEDMKRRFLDPRQLSKTRCFELTRDQWVEEGREVPVAERMAQIVLSQIDRKVAAYHRLGEQRFNSDYATYIERDYTLLATNDVWISDGHDFDVFVRVPGREKPIRPTLLSWMDVRSRRIVGWRIIAGAENADVVLAAFRDGVAACGLPRLVHHDNGSAYDAKSLQGMTKRQRRRRRQQGGLPFIEPGVFERVGLQVMHSLPRNAKAKLIERYHRTLCERFAKLIPTYCGGNSESRPHNLAEKLVGQDVPTLDELREAFRVWVEKDYHVRPHRGDGMDDRSPGEVYAAELDELRPVDADTLALELAPRRRVKVGRNGVTHNGIIYTAPELDSLFERTVVVLENDADVRQVTILREDEKFLCHAQARRKMPYLANKEMLRAAMAEQRRERKRVREARKGTLRVVDDPIDRMNRSQVEATPVPTPASIRPHQSKLTAQKDKILRRAADAAEAAERAASMRLFEETFGHRVPDEATEQPGGIFTYKRRTPGDEDEPQAPTLDELFGDPTRKAGNG